MEVERGTHRVEREADDRPEVGTLRPRVLDLVWTSEVGCDSTLLLPTDPLYVGSSGSINAPLLHGPRSGYGTGQTGWTTHASGSDSTSSL